MHLALQNKHLCFALCMVSDKFIYIDILRKPDLNLDNKVNNELFLGFFHRLFSMIVVLLFVGYQMSLSTIHCSYLYHAFIMPHLCRKTLLSWLI